ncbi:hypothetical protein M2475_001138 [Breznakia sp. PF5-3]|uniref:hypothetical protein n=1 Tax=unclassified Breznakia TaxID=2623764 RepID=UPI00240538BB|nr:MULTISPECIES: hypothetical protein [unclassified Breznakia]MDF9824636.1 hypothetical protein [Breznakia sp. PM6-1]MDF9835572.1 hypothetical protein [Breznakia sp. PF5-3]MDF9838690.1 hypothetical protein [Breznakia sp. PFB2-8]MDF9860721.1 hypothetical protein [Breznakia sp. PH5-24]
MKEWSLFMISMGCLLILLSSTVVKGLGIMVSGILLTAVGVYLLLKKKKGSL